MSVGDVPYLIADDAFFRLVVQDWHGEAACVVFVAGEVNLSEMREFRVQRVRNGVLAWQLFVRSDESPS